MSILGGLLGDDDIWRLKMGRFSDADENMMRRLVEGRGGSKLWRELFGAGVDVRKVGYVSSRPRMGSRGATFGFSHRWVTKEVRRSASPDRVYFACDRASAKSVGAKWDRKVSWGGGSKGAWSVAKGSSLPKGAVYAVGARVETGWPAGTARAFQGYMEREGAAVYCLAANGDTHELRASYWDAVEARERHGGRVQGRIIAELPYEEIVGDEGRRTIVASFARFFEENRLPFSAVIHAPEKQNDPRNWHMHLAYHDRPIERWEDGCPIFAGKKSDVVRGMGFVAQMRDRWAECANVVLERCGVERRYDPRSYEEAGVGKTPAPHLGNSSMARERMGVATEAGARATGAVLIERVDAAQRRLSTIAQEHLARLREPLRLVEAAAPTDGHMREAASGLADAATGFAQAGAVFREALARRMVAVWSARDLPRRLGLAKRRPGRIGEMAGLLEEDCRRETTAALRLRVTEERAAQAAFREAQRGLTKAESELASEGLVAALRRARHELDLEVDRVRRDGRLSPAEWLARGRKADVELRRRILARAEAIERLRGLAGRVLGVDGAARLVTELGDRHRRREVIEALGSGAAAAKGIPADLVEMARFFGRLDRSVAAAEAVLARRNRVERDTGAFARLVRSPAAQAVVETSLARTTNAYEAAELAVRGDRRARDLALSRGLIRPGQGRDERKGVTHD